MLAIYQVHLQPASSCRYRQHRLARGNGHFHRQFAFHISLACFPAVIPCGEEEYDEVRRERNTDTYKCQGYILAEVRRGSWLQYNAPAIRKYTITA